MHVNPGQSLLTAHLDDALEQPVCPLCHLVVEAEHRYLDLLLYQSVNDIGVRRNLRRSKGLCTYHTHLLVEIGGYGAHATLCTIYRDLVHALEDDLAEMDRHPRQPLMSVDCPACHVMRETEQRFAEVLARRLADRAMRERYQASTGLCMRHLDPVYQRASREVQRFLQANQTQRVQQLSHELGEFIRKSISKNEPFGAERDVWIRSVRFYAGLLRPVSERLPAAEDEAAPTPEEAAPAPEEAAPDKRSDEMV